MKFQVPRDVLAEAVQWTARAVPQRPAIPILAGVKIQAADEVLGMSSYDYESSAQSTVAANVEEPGEVLVPGRLLSDISKSFPKQDIMVETHDNQVELSCGNAHFVLPTMAIEEYPQLPALPTLRGTVDAKEFATAIAQAAIASSNDETLAILTGVKVQFEGDKLKFMATDRYRLTYKEITWQPVDPSFTADLLVKARVLTDISKSMTSTGNIQLMVSDENSAGSTLIGFECEGRQATSSLMDGEYPQVMKLFPEETPIVETCLRQDLLDAVSRMSLVVERNTSVRLHFAGTVLRLEAGSQGNNAQAQEEIALSGTDEEFTTAFNPDYLRAGISALKGDYVNFGFTHPSKAVVITGKAEMDGEIDESFRYLLMPIRVDS